ncbi:MAG TPA: serine hydrolase domain-containing protein, partial [Caldilineaceae bacterium]|nr:serine hydrolase domain-containing protein [Caldilineaceae bacterium]
GQQEIATGQPMQEDTIVRIYSMTKPITSLAALMLYEQGQLLLSDPLAQYIPAFAEARVLVRQAALDLELAPLRRPITLRDLITHTSGLSYGFFLDSPVEAMYKALHDVTDFVGEPRLYPHHLTMAELVEKWAKIPLIHQPGTAWRYSVGTDVLGRVIEVISGQSLGEFLRTQLFEPLGMVDSAFSVPAPKINRLAAMYTAEGAGALRVIDRAAGSRFAQAQLLESGGGGLVSTAADYWRFAQMLLNGGELDGVRLLSRKTVELMSANQLAPGLLPMRNGDDIFPGEGFGLGVGVILNQAESQIPWSAGSYYWGGAASTTFWIDPREQLIGILLAQYMPSDSYPLNDHFRVLTYSALAD